MAKIESVAVLVSGILAFINKNMSLNKYLKYTVFFMSFVHSFVKNVKLLQYRDAFNILMLGAINHNLLHPNFTTLIVVFIKLNIPIVLQRMRENIQNITVTYETYFCRNLFYTHTPFS